MLDYPLGNNAVVIGTVHINLIFKVFYYTEGNSYRCCDITNYSLIMICFNCWWPNPINHFCD